MVSQGDLERGVHRLRARVGEKAVIDIAGHQRLKLFRQSEGAGVAHLENGREVELGGLPGDGLHDGLAAVAGIHAPQAGGAVQYRAAAFVRVMHVPGRNQQARRRFERAVGGEGQPVGFEIVVAGHGLAS